MTSIKVKFRPSEIGNREGTVYYQVIHARKVRHISTAFRILPDYWDEARSTVSHKFTGKSVIPLSWQIRTDVERLYKIAAQLGESTLSYSADDIVAEYRNFKAQSSLISFMKGIIEKLRQVGKVRTAETYTATLGSFRKFLGDISLPGGDLRLEYITPELMEAYQAWHQKKGNSPNTVSFYLRILRAAYNRAIEAGLTADRHPFRRVYTGIDKTVKRAIPLSTIRKIKALDLSGSPLADYARDMFLMSFYLRGMSFVDMAFLKKSDLKNGSIVYRRRKTGQQLTIGWTKEMQAILDKYPPNATQYLLPIIRSVGCNERCAYKNAGNKINYTLKKIAAMVGITIPLTMYVARHSWASAAKSHSIPLSVISEGMGHDSESTTRIYLAALDTSVVNEANALIIGSLG